MVLDFVDGWAIIQTLGEGAFGEVKLLLNKQNGDMVALKCVDQKKHPEAKELTRKEVVIHRMLKHPGIIAFLGHRLHGHLLYIFLEYASNGELFDKIEPDVGMDTSEAQKYMLQLTSGVEYLHEMGVAHRDLKPENLLLDAQDNLKISDLGLATFFRAKGKERLLDKKCGTVPYVAPEVLCRPYAAEPADVWSCGIVLVAMLAGELPWDCADAEKCREYALWKKGEYASVSPWTKVSTMALSLLRRILAPAPSQRAKLSFIKQHRWLAPRHISTKSGDDIDCGAPKRKLSRVDSEMCRARERKHLLEGLVRSQPVGGVHHIATSEASADSEAHPFIASTTTLHQISFSQPESGHDMLLPSQGFALTQTQQSHLNPLQKLVKRMTRFCVTLSVEESVSELTRVLTKYSLDYKLLSPACVSVETVDRRKTRLVFRAQIMEMEPGVTLLDFRLSRGCGLEFKKYFLSVKSSFSQLLISPPSWAAALSLPDS